MRLSGIILFICGMVFSHYAYGQITENILLPVPSKTASLNHIQNNSHNELLIFTQNTVKSEAKTAVKSPFKAAVLSGILPGAGQWYAGNKKRAIAFFTTELFLWYGHSYYNGTGGDWRRDFRAYADKYWSRAEYEDWRTTDPDTIRYLTHSLPATCTQQYYEMIGKYDQFLAGWPDSKNESEQSQMRLHYMDMQHKSNMLYKHAEVMAQLLIIHRVISAAEAALSVKRKNNNISAHLNVQYNSSMTGITPTLVITCKW